MTESISTIDPDELQSSLPADYEGALSSKYLPFADYVKLNNGIISPGMREFIDAIDTRYGAPRENQPKSEAPSSEVNADITNNLPMSILKVAEMLRLAELNANSPNGIDPKIMKILAAGEGVLMPDQLLGMTDVPENGGLSIRDQMYRIYDDPESEFERPVPMPVIPDEQLTDRQRASIALKEQSKAHKAAVLNTLIAIERDAVQHGNEEVWSSAVEATREKHVLQRGSARTIDQIEREIAGLPAVQPNPEEDMLTATLRLNVPFLRLLDYAMSPPNVNGKTEAELTISPSDAVRLTQ